MKNVLFVALSLCLWIGVASTQKTPSKSSASSSSSTMKLIGLRVTGSQRYTEKEILPASGLRMGQPVSEADLKEGASRLGNTGLFSDVAYTFSYSSAGTKVEFQLTDIDESKLVPAHFENFVWFTDEEILAEIQKQVPLFRERIPTSGAMPDEIEQALQSMIDAKKIPARVDYLRQAPQQGGSLTGMDYRVVALEIKIRDVEFPGATPDQLPRLQAAARKLVGSPFMRSPLADVARIEFMPVCLQRGYLKAEFGAAQARVVSQKEDEVEVDAILPLTPGKVYSTSGIEWKGNQVIASQDLQRLIHLTEARPADAVQLVSDVEAVAKLYHSKGYMAARIIPKPSLDDARSTVHYELDVTEGDQFKMGEFEVLGLDSQARAHLQSAWKLREGDPYDSEYPRRFLNENTRLVPGGVPWKIGIHEAVNDKDKTVDITIRFSAN